MYRQKIKHGVIPVGGKGNRISELPFTRILPKPMLPVLNRPLLEYVVQNMVSAGVVKIYFITGNKGNIIRRYFGNGRSFGFDAYYIRDTTISGLANAIYLAKPFIKEPFITILGDDLTIGTSWPKIIETFFKTKALVVEGIVRDADADSIRRACEVRLGNKNKILDILEKPLKVKTFLRGCGIYVFQPEIFRFIKNTRVNPRTGKRELTDAIRNAAKQGLAYGHILEGENININTLSDLIRANKLLLSLEGKI